MFDAWVHLLMMGLRSTCCDVPRRLLSSTPRRRSRTGIGAAPRPSARRRREVESEHRLSPAARAEAAARGRRPRRPATWSPDAERANLAQDPVLRSRRRRGATPNAGRWTEAGCGDHRRDPLRCQHTSAADGAPAACGASLSRWTAMGATERARCAIAVARDPRPPAVHAASEYGTEAGGARASLRRDRRRQTS